MTTTVDLQLACEFDNLPSAEQFQRWAALVLDELKPNSEITIRISDAEESQSLNHSYRGKDKPTNVLSFEFDAPPGVELPLVGDLIICPEVVYRESLEQQKSFHGHFAHMVVHGCLHLLGYDHINDADAQEMEAIEKRLLATIDISDPYRDDEC
ncbi:rRNA maturation RNase YbeY [Pseudoalteromonas ruthenica]|uniref:Endoribonuclease YbeY n=1 Tax=Pseudoalteromonas ruthenica TaxID=151081 RepID=A0A0F4PP54_9GAMM|nr:rRNA maturation RNase YbeY [Pseudoalteromonas ruthenica]KJY96001.1 endoribonuclease YbeY [Pseudoalteromonas ruthenica]KJY96848.1 endoribonuclease YbeY [Pseudoalteromonas ruthenica]TMO88872.1 rRNA maturation RNase YbeY [Pseudoalteromonas ruthenica]TMO91407.1 rRNA maturation RNase YbeY [Pseudoalteromonas ruthenica]TMP01507.1 rRNA maturation RNase YbeY [Pseudoalteromonas ruthenica]